MDFPLSDFFSINGKMGKNGPAVGGLQGPTKLALDWGKRLGQGAGGSSIFLNSME